MAWNHPPIRTRLHELVELLHMALLNVELITKLSNVWMDPVNESLGVKSKEWNGKKNINTPTQMEKQYGKTLETKTLET